METDPSLLSFNVALGVLLVDILLSGDNAIVIALVCRSLSKQHRTKALWLGVIGAIVARLVLTTSATLAMSLPLIKLVGGLLLLKISVELIVQNANQGVNAREPELSSANDIFSAAKTIVLADMVMSLDNVLALSAITQNNWQMLVAGLLLSIPILMFGSLYLSRLLDVFPYLLWIGGAILGGVSGALIIDDPVFDGAFNNASSIAPLVVPILCAGFVVLISRVIALNALRMQALGKPPQLLDILWRGTLDAPLPRRPVDDSAASVSEVPVVASVPPAQLVVAETVAPATPSVTAAAAVPPATGSIAGEHRVVLALGMFMLLAGGALYYLLNVYQPAEPERYLTYFCPQPAMTISVLPNARQIRFTTPKGSAATTVVDDRIVWDDAADVRSKLSVAPPQKIVSIDAQKLVVDGGQFSNTSCMAPPR